MKKIMISPLVFFFSCLLGLGCAGSCPQQKGPREPNLPKLSIGGKTVFVEVADNDKERAKGLMERESLPENQGMIFVYSSDAKRSFWMKKTLIDLSIAFVDKDGVIFQISDMKAHDETPVESKKPARYALEVNKGWFEKQGVKVGDKITGIKDAQNWKP